MNKKLVVLFSLLVTVLSLSIQTYAKSKTELALDATSENPVESKEAIASLRAMGAEGLREIFDVYEKDILQYMKTGEQTAEWLKIAAALSKTRSPTKRKADFVFVSFRKPERRI
jgi:hypothetical protein